MTEAARAVGVDDLENIHRQAHSKSARLGFEVFTASTLGGDQYTGKFIL
jgi:hypothetical protein